jgi:hypothetical protein
LREAGEKVERHADHFEPGTADVEWLTTIAEQGWMILVKDEAIGRRPLERDAVSRAGACVFVLASQQMTGPEMAEAFVKARNRMKQFARKHRGPFIAKVYRDGAVKMWKGAEDL